MRNAISKKVFEKEISMCKKLNKENKKGNATGENAKDVG